MSSPSLSHPMYVSLDDLMSMVREAAQRTGVSLEPAHPEDMVSNVVPLMEAIAVGFSAGFSRGRHG